MRATSYGRRACNEEAISCLDEKNLPISKRSISDVARATSANVAKSPWRGSL